MTAFSYSQEAREQAKREKLALFSCEVDGRTAKDGLTGKYTFDGPLDVRMARALWFFCFDLSHSNPVKAFNEWFPNGNPAPIPKAKKSKRSK
jgi:hypothetical protein